jgi:hypothetical protein
LALLCLLERLGGGFSRKKVASTGGDAKEGSVAIKSGNTGSKTGDGEGKDKGDDRGDDSGLAAPMGGSSLRSSMMAALRVSANEKLEGILYRRDILIIKL